MKTLLHVFFVVLFLVGVFTLPWWVVVPYALLLIAYARAFVSVIVGGLFFDALYGASGSFAHPWGGAYLYTLLFASLTLLAFVLRRRLLE